MTRWRLCGLRHISRGVLTYLAQTQANEISAEQDSEPGKILHEARNGEMAALGEIPFGRYYGSVDSTPLYLMLAGAYYGGARTLAFLESIWPNIELAVKWMDQYGDATATASSNTFATLRMV